MRSHIALRLRSFVICFLLAASLSTATFAQSTPERAEACALKGVLLSPEGAAQTLLLSGGRIEAILEVDAKLPAGVRIIEADGLLAVPAFVDAFSSEGCEAPEVALAKDKPASTKANVLIDMREANRKGIQPAFRAVDVLKLTPEATEKCRKAGFGALLSSPRGQLLSGASVLATTRDAAMRDIVLRESPLRHAAFSASGSGYPVTLMAYHAQLRQFFLDAARHADLVERWEAGRPGARPAFDADLEAGRALLAREHRLLCEADGHRDVERWIRLADEFGLDIAISGGRDAWKVASLLSERKIPVFMTLDWGDEVEDPDKDEESKESEDSEDSEEDSETEQKATEESDDAAVEEDAWIYDAPLSVERDKRRIWVEKRDSALRLHEAGVPIAFCSGSSSAQELMKRVRTLVENGFPEDVALKALTETPALLLGAEKHVGKLEPGYQAAVALWTETPTNEKAKVAWIVVDGFPYEFDIEETDTGPPDEGVDLTGTWTMDFTGEEENRTATLVLEMDETGEVTGSYAAKNEMAPSGELAGDISGHVSGSSVRLETTISVGELNIELVFEGEFAEDAFQGSMEMKSSMFEDTRKYTAARTPEQLHKGGQ